MNEFTWFRFKVLTSIIRKGFIKLVLNFSKAYLNCVIPNKPFRKLIPLSPLLWKLEVQILFASNYIQSLILKGLFIFYSFFYVGFSF